MKRNFIRALSLCRELGQYFRHGARLGLFQNYFSAFFSLFITHTNNLRGNLSSIIRYNKEMLHKLQKTTKGLHALLPKNPLFSYSILIPVEHPDPKWLLSCLRSVCVQTAPEFEVILGVIGPIETYTHKVLEQVEKEFPNKISVKSISNTQNPYESLTAYANGHFLLLVEPHDWLRPDFLYRYEQVLQSVSDPEAVVVCSDENRIDGNDNFLAMSDIKRNVPNFPYYFDSAYSLRGCLIPKKAWVKSIQKSLQYSDAWELAMALQLTQLDVKFISIPLSLYSRRGVERAKARDFALKAMQDYTQSLGLNWKWEPGYRNEDLRAVPQADTTHKVQVVIPFKEQNALTISCVKALKEQKGVEFKITAVDNGSTDTSIADEIRALGGEVLTILEPFNFSRLNNLAVKHTKTAQDCDLLLFLNNDVDLDQGALLEMVRWAGQPQIGMVGCRLHYPDGRLQHGGVEVDYFRAPGTMAWIHIEKMKTFQEMEQTKQLGIKDAVTAACCLVRRKDFEAVGGFDEIWYPIAYSDTNLAVRLAHIGLKAFYTPYASGVHHESISRKDGIEDFENSVWLHNHLKLNC